MIIKSPYEVATIFELLDGANDVEITPCPEDRLDLKKSWNARSLKLFSNGNYSFSLLQKEQR